MLEGAGHAVDLGRAGARRLSGVAPSRCHGRDLLDDGTGLRQRQAEETRSGFQQVERTGAFIEIDIRRQHPRLEIGRNGIEVVGWGKRPSRLSEPEEAVVA